MKHEDLCPQFPFCSSYGDLNVKKKWKYWKVKYFGLESTITMFFLSALARGTCCYGSNVARERTASQKKKKKKKKKNKENQKKKKKKKKKKTSERT